MSAIIAKRPVLATGFQFLLETLFGEGGSTDDRHAALRQRSSLLDFIKEDMTKLRRELGPSDRAKVDDYLQAVRAVERRIQKSEADVVDNPLPDLDRPVGVPAAYADQARLMFDLQLLARQGDITRVAASGFDVSNTLSSQIDLNATIACAERISGESATIRVSVIGNTPTTIEKRAYRMELNSTESHEWNSDWSRATTRLNQALRRVGEGTLSEKETLDRLIAEHGLIFGSQTFEDFYQNIYEDHREEQKNHKWLPFPAIAYEHNMLNK